MLRSFKNMHNHTVFLITFLFSLTRMLETIAIIGTNDIHGYAFPTNITYAKTG